MVFSSILHYLKKQFNSNTLTAQIIILIESKSVITNNSGPNTFVRIKRGSLYRIAVLA
jgi:hypothetical protein